MKLLELLAESPASHLSTRNKPFTPEEIQRIEHWLTAFEEKGKDSISAKALGFRGELSYGQMREREGFQKGQKAYRKQQLSLNQIYAQDQDGVNIGNLRRVLANWDKAPLPEALLLPDGTYWLIEGHHRLALQRLAKRSKMEILVEYKKNTNR